jgi:hypothetical protein
MTIKRWVIRRKSDGLYIGWNADHVNLFNAELYESEEEANLHCYDSNEEPIPVRVTIEEEPATPPTDSALREALRVANEALDQDIAQQMIPDRSRKEELEARKTGLYKYMAKIQSLLAAALGRPAETQGLHQSPECEAGLPGYTWPPVAGNRVQINADGKLISDAPSTPAPKRNLK